MPMYGAQIAFRNYNAADGILGSVWVGMKHFVRFFTSPQFGIIVKNTLVLAVYTQLISMPFPILLAIGLNYSRSSKLKKTVQMITYLPHFLSTVIIVSLITMLFNYQTGLVSNISNMLFGQRVDIMNVLQTSSIFLYDLTYGKMQAGAQSFMFLRWQVLTRHCTRRQ